MPKLLAFLPCAASAIDRDDNSYSLLRVLETVHVGPLDDSDPPSGAAAPFGWVVFTHWLAETDDAESRWIQRVVLTAPDGTTHELPEQPVDLSLRTARVRMNIDAFPVFGPGDTLLGLELRRPDVAEPWTRVAEYPIAVVITRPEAVESAV